MKETVDFAMGNGSSLQKALYDIEADRTELNNLASVYPEIATEMIEKYEKWASRVGVINWQERKKK
jgi:arylsulfatase